MKVGARQFELDGAGPLYRQIRRAIATPILSGEMSPGTRLPSEHDFMALFDTSRMTVNRALQMLADEGLVRRHRRRGTFVALQMGEHSVMQLRPVVEEVAGSGAQYRYQLLAERSIKADRGIARRLEIRTGKKVLYLRCLHMADDRPYVLEDRYINLKSVPDVSTGNFSETPLNEWLIENVAWTRAEHVIMAINANAEVSDLLQIETAAACLQMQRTTWQAKCPITSVTLTYPGGGHRLTGSFAPGV